MGCEIARRMGLPIEKLVMPTNENDEFPRFLETGIYEKISPSRACLSNAMNVGHPSNLARFFDLYQGTVDKSGYVWVTPDVERMRQRIFSTSVTNKETKERTKRAWYGHGLLLEPHGAVGWEGLDRYLKQREGNDYPLCVSVETAHPAKFPEIIKYVLDFEPELPESMRGIDERQGEAVELSGGYPEFKEFLVETLKKEV
jgi:threonine synthase